MSKINLMIALTIGLIGTNAFAEGFRTNSAGRAYYCSTCDGHSGGGNRIDIHVPAGTSQKEIDRLVKESREQFYRVQKQYAPKVSKPATVKPSEKLTVEQAQTNYEKATAAYNKACPYGCGGKPLELWKDARDTLALATMEKSK